MPAAFTFICPTELEDVADNYAEFQKAGVEVYIVTTDTHFSHKVWHETSPAVGKAKFPLVGDPTHTLTRAFGVHIEEEGLALRGTFVINPDGVIKTVEIHDNGIARDVKETAAQAQGRPVRRRAPGRSLPGQVEGRREDARRRRSTWSARSKPQREPPIRSRFGGGADSSRKRPASPVSLKFSDKGEQHARRQPQGPTQGLPRKAAAADRARRLARRQRRGAGDARAARRHRRAVGQGQRARRRRRRARARRSRSAAPARRRASASPACRWATNSPRWCWPCCRSAAIRPRSTPT